MAEFSGLVEASSFSAPCHLVSLLLFGTMCVVRPKKAHDLVLLSGSFLALSISEKEENMTGSTCFLSRPFTLSCSDFPIVYGQEKLTPTAWQL